VGARARARAGPGWADARAGSGRARGGRAGGRPADEGWDCQGFGPALNVRAGSADGPVTEWIEIAVGAGGAWLWDV
jgi:hypothetical protein